LAGTGLAGASLAASALSTTALSVAAAGPAGAAGDPGGGDAPTVPFHGPHQAGITTPEQGHLVFATYDVTATGRAALATLLATWTDAAHRLTAGLPVDGPSGPLSPPADTGEAVGLGPSRLTLTLGFGPTLFDDRFGLGPHRPDALVDLPAFAGDALDPQQSGGDLCVQACAADARVAFHAVHNLTHLALGSATVRSLQLGFGRTASPGDGQPAPRNLIGFQDGTDNLVPTDTAAMDRFVWADRAGGPAWMAGGTYLVARRIRIHLEAWERSTLHDQEQTIGRRKANGAALGSSGPADPVDLAAVGPDGHPVIPSNAHIRVAAPASNGGEAILRRGYSFADGIDPVTGELDAGLFFICFQRDPRRQFIPIQQALADGDALAQYLETTGSALFACPPGIGPGQSWGHGLV
jgi:deferrochelatase/peroxidase EfeB